MLFIRFNFQNTLNKSIKPEIIIKKQTNKQDFELNSTT